MATAQAASWARDEHLSLVKIGMMWASTVLTLILTAVDVGLVIVC